jgi:hypothetical protein
LLSKIEKCTGIFYVEQNGKCEKKWKWGMGREEEEGGGVRSRT